jgi:hypothetical protein
MVYYYNIHPPVQSQITTHRYITSSLSIRRSCVAPLTPGYVGSGGGGVRRIRSGGFGFSSGPLPGLVSARCYTYIIRVARIVPTRRQIAVAIALAWWPTPPLTPLGT